MENTKKINEMITVGPQPSKEELGQLREDGFASVANLRTAGEKDQPMSPQQEGQEAKRLGMTFHHEPVDEKQMNEEQVDRFRAKLEELPKPVYVHCKSGMRAGAFVMMDQAVKQGMSGQETLETAEEMGFECKQPELKKFVTNYVNERSGSREGTTA